MRKAEDIVNVVGMLWEGLQDVGIRVDYCALEVIDERKSIDEIYAAAPAWLTKRYGIKPLQRNIIPGVHCYYKKVSLEEDITAWQGQPLSCDRHSDVEPGNYVEYFQWIWRIRVQDNVESPKSWMIVPFAHGLLNIHSFKPNLFSEKTVQVLKSFADAISLAYARLLDFQRLEQRNEELQQAYQKLKQLQVELVQSSKMASLGELVSGISHEINTPLGTLQSNFDIYIRSFEKLQKVLPESPTSRIDNKATDLTKIFVNIDKLNAATKTAIQRIDTIVSSLRKFARLDRAGMDNIDIYEGLEATLKLIEPELRNRIEIKKDYSELPVIYYNPDQLNQAFMNILLNAIHAIDGKGKIFIKTYHLNDFVIIEIRDTGKGIAKEHLERIFDPGFTTKGVGVGTGMGLSIVYKIIKDHNGKIEVESELGE
ncbi:MAG: sensor histidine kinase, partial [Planctomycetota bacterium]